MASPATGRACIFQVEKPMAHGKGKATGKGTIAARHHHRQPAGHGNRQQRQGQPAKPVSPGQRWATGRTCIPAARHHRQPAGPASSRSKSQWAHGKGKGKATGKETIAASGTGPAGRGNRQQRQGQRAKHHRASSGQAAGPAFQRQGITCKGKACITGKVHFGRMTGDTPPCFFLRYKTCWYPDGRRRLFLVS